jgi:tetratricopeptide (TPR) repeat protein
MPPDIPTAKVMEHLLSGLPPALKRHNHIYGDSVQIQLRVAANVGPVTCDTIGMSGEAIILVARLLDAPVLKKAIDDSGAHLGVIVSSFVYETAIKHGEWPIDPVSYVQVQVDVKETCIPAWMQLINPVAGHTAPDQALRTTAPPLRPSPDQGGRPAVPAGQAAPRQLPTAPAYFTGRDDELSELSGLLEGGAGTPGTVLISAIGGTAGIGKTALAVHWAHQAAGQFPDGQLYINLRGFDPGGTPARPDEAIRAFLDALGVSPRRIPASLDAQVGLYRSTVADKRMLIVLDNASDEAQVRPLLPGAAGSLVLITSRSQLTGLAAAEGARLLTLGPLTGAAAHELLARRLGAERLAAEPEAAPELARLCARLPLALSITAARAAARPGLRLAEFAAELRDASGRLDALDAGDPAACARTVFSWSYRHLTPDAARMFRLLGLHPGPDISGSAAASLVGEPPGQARRTLRELTRSHLLTEHGPGRYAFHDLLRAYAAEQAAAAEDEDGQREAIHRMLDHYLQTAHSADLLLEPSRTPITVDPPLPGVSPEHLGGQGQAMAWFGAEHQVVLGAINLAADTGFDIHAWQLPWSLTAFFQGHGHWQEWLATGHTALTAAERLGDPAGQAHAHHQLGTGFWHAGLYIPPGTHDKAVSHLRRAIELFRSLGNDRGQASSQNALGVLCATGARYDQALGHFQQALALYQEAGDQIGQAFALNNVGYNYVSLGAYQQALDCCLRAVDLQRENGSLRDLASALDSLGYVYHHLRQYAGAVTCYQQALDLLREVGDLHSRPVAPGGKPSRSWTTCGVPTPARSAQSSAT